MAPKHSSLSSPENDALKEIVELEDGATPTKLVDEPELSKPSQYPKSMTIQDSSDESDPPLPTVINLHPKERLAPSKLGPTFPIDLIRSRQGDAPVENKKQPSDNETTSVASQTIAQASVETPAEPSPSDLPNDWVEVIKTAISILEKDIDAEKDKDAQDHVKREAYLRMLRLIINDPKSALEPIAKLDKAEQEFWNDLVFGLNVYFDHESNPRDGNRKTLALVHLRRAINFLSAVSNLDVRNVRFCSRVDSYGRFEEFSAPVFRPGQEVILYVEVENFSADQEKLKGHYETALVGSYEIRDAVGRRVAEHGYMTEREICRNRRRDFFIPYRMYVPKKLTSGQYTLQVTMQDVKSKRTGQSTSISFTIKE